MCVCIAGKDCLGAAGVVVITRRKTQSTAIDLKTSGVFLFELVTEDAFHIGY